MKCRRSRGTDEALGRAGTAVWRASVPARTPARRRPEPLCSDDRFGLSSPDRSGDAGGVLPGRRAGGSRPDGVLQVIRPLRCDRLAGRTTGHGERSRTETDQEHPSNQGRLGGRRPSGPTGRGGDPPRVSRRSNDREMEGRPVPGGDPLGAGHPDGLPHRADGAVAPRPSGTAGGGRGSTSDDDRRSSLMFDRLPRPGSRTVSGGESRRSTSGSR
jgi:hypothetical protein